MKTTLRLIGFAVIVAITLGVWASLKAQCGSGASNTGELIWEPLALATHFKTLAETFQASDEYPENLVIEENAGRIPHLYLRPSEVNLQREGDLEFVVNRALVIGVLRTFIHTSYESVTVTVEPVVDDSSGGTTLPADSVTVSVQRSDVLAYLNQNGIASFDMLVGERIGERTWPDVWNARGRSYLSNDQGSPTAFAFTTYLRSVDMGK